MPLAATYPERVTSLVLVNRYGRYARSTETPWGMPARLIPSYIHAIEEAWGTGAVTETIAPTFVNNDEARRRWARMERVWASPDVVAAMVRAVIQTDVIHVLPAVRAPTLVISRAGDRHVRHEHGRYVATHRSPPRRGSRRPILRIQVRYDGLKTRSRRDVCLDNALRRCAIPCGAKHPLRASWPTRWLRALSPARSVRGD